MPNKFMMRISTGISRIRTEMFGFIAVGGHLLLLDQNASSSSVEDEGDVDMPELKLNSSMILIGVEVLPGQPEIVKLARNGC